MCGSGDLPCFMKWKIVWLVDFIFDISESIWLLSRVHEHRTSDKDKQGNFVWGLMAARVDLMPLPPFDPLTEPSSITQCWKTWKHRFKTYLIALNVTEGKQKGLYSSIKLVSPHKRYFWHAPKLWRWRGLWNSHDKAEWILLAKTECGLQNFSASTGCPKCWRNSWSICHSIEKTGGSLWISKPGQTTEVSHHPELPVKTSSKIYPLWRSSHTGWTSAQS